MGLTTLNLETGLTVLTGGVGTGKTEVLVGLGVEFRDAGLKVAMLSAEQESEVIARRFPTLRFPCIDIDSVDVIERVLQDRYEVVLVDGFTMLVAPDTGKTAPLARALNDLAFTARDRGIYMVVTIQTRRAHAGKVDFGMAQHHHYPMIRLQERA